MKKILLTIAVTIFYTALTIAQTGPGGVGNSTDNAVWLDASRLSLNNNDPVTTWTDFSGNGNDFTQGTANRQPTFLTNQINAQPSINFSQDFLDLSTTSDMNSANFTQFIVGKAVNANNTRAVLRSSYSSGASTSSSTYHGFYLSTSGNQYYTHSRNTSGVAVSAAMGYQAGYNILSSVINSGTSTVTGYLNNNLTNTTAGYNSTPNGHLQTRIGSNTGSASGGLFFAGTMSEVIIYNRALNTAEHNIINNYLAVKYRRTISNDLYSHELTHYHEVFGVGQESDGGNTTAQGTGIVEFSNPVLTDGDYILAGHNNGSIMASTNDVPASIAPASRLQRLWRVDATGSPGTLTISFDISGTVYAGETSLSLVVEDNDGIFNNGNTTVYGPATPVGNIVTFTGVSLPDNSYFTLFGPSQPIESIASGNWNSTSTWNCGCVPGQNDDATIKASHNVTLNVNSSINDLTIEATGTLTHGTSKKLSVYGNLTINGGLSHSTGTTDFVGTGTQAFDNGSGSSLAIYNLNVSGGSTVELKTGSFSVSNAIKVSSGQLSNVSGTFTLLSTSSKQAVVLPSTSNAFAGNFIIQRHISTRNASYGDLSSPVSSATLGDWDSDPSGTVNEIFMSGVSGLNGNSGNFQSVYYYDEVGQSYVAVTDTNESLSIAKGFEVWLEDAAGTWNAKTFDTRGTPNSGSIAKPVKNAWNLVGNPYPAWIIWSKLTKPTLKPTYYIWNTNNGTYDAKTNGSIPPHQGFWVESTGNGSLVFNENDKYTTTNSTFWRESGEEMFTEVKLKVSSTLNTYKHELKLRVNNMADIAQDYYDASFLPSRIIEAPSITSFASNSNKKLAINSFNYQDEVILPIKVKVGISGEYMIEPINFAELSPDYSVMELTDTKTGKVYNLNNIYTDGIKVNIDESEDIERFELRLSNNATSFASEIENSGINVYKSSEFTVIEFDNTEVNYIISVYNVVGQKVIENLSSSYKKKILINNSELPSGVNIINIKSLNKNFTKKLTY